MKISDIKVGMKVKIKSAEKLCKENNISRVSNVLNFNRSGKMDKYCGKTYKVLVVRENTIKLSTPENNWIWHPKALELPNKKLSFKEIL